MREEDSLEQARSLFEAYADDLYRLCVYYLGNHQDAQDAVQETAVRLIEAAPEFTDESHGKYWLMKVAANECRKVLRHWWRKRRVDVPEMPEHATPDDTEHAELAEALRALAVKQRVALYLFYYVGYSTREIAALTGEREGTVRVRLHRGREALRGMLQTEEERGQVTAR